MINCDNTPKISVIMPVYNADSFLEESILSIINQTYKNFELIIICSKPTKYTSNLLATFKKKDTRIIIHYQEKKGIISARNFGCKIARGEYIAIMDADDISEPERLAIQIEFLEKNPAFSVVGSWVDIIDDKGRCIKKERPPTQPDVIGWHLFLGNCIMHSSVLIRTDLLKKLHYYSGSDIGFPEDYNLWMKVFFCTKLAIISKPLVKYRMHNKNTSFDSIWMKKNEFYKNIIRNDMVK
ncbi:MAG: glycosyltransferase, partial [Crenarchaeota archaeon]|nr:glycosyltransferase [Thermoproteota archaeon]